MGDFPKFGRIYFCQRIAGNYRTVSLTFITCKLLEHIISSNIMCHLEGMISHTDYSIVFICTSLVRLN